MSTTNKAVKTAEEKVAIRDAKILKLQNEKKQILQREKAKERKERTHRLCRRHGLLEKFLPDIITITDEQFEAFVRTHIKTKNGMTRLAEIIDKGAEAAAAYIAKCHNENGTSGDTEPPEVSAAGA
jgi:Mn-dependent DtxR family transcriptional regulator